MPLGEEVSLDTLEPADELVHQAPDLREVAPDGQHLCAEAVLHGVAHAQGKRRLELGGRRGECLDLLARSLERRVERRRLDAAGCGLIDPLLCALDRVGVHPGRR